MFPECSLFLRRQHRTSTSPTKTLCSIDLEDSNLFALNRFPGYDRWEDALRVTYGFDWSLDRRLVHRYHDRPELPARRSARHLPARDRVTDRLSRYRGRTSVRYGRLLELTHRFRIDKDNFAVRRNEIDLTIVTHPNYAQVGYLKLNRNVDPTIEDLRDVEELRVAGRILFNRYRSVFGAAVVDLTDKNEIHCQLLTGSSRCAIDSIEYEDDCLQIGLTWKRDFERVGTFRTGNSFGIHLALKGIGR